MLFFSEVKSLQPSVALNVQYANSETQNILQWVVNLTVASTKWEKYNIKYKAEFLISEFPALLSEAVLNHIIHFRVGSSPPAATVTFVAAALLAKWLCSSSEVRRRTLGLNSQSCQM